MRPVKYVWNENSEFKPSKVVMAPRIIILDREFWAWARPRMGARALLPSSIRGAHETSHGRSTPPYAAITVAPSVPRAFLRPFLQRSWGVFEDISRGDWGPFGPPTFHPLLWIEERNDQLEKSFLNQREKRFFKYWTIIKKNIKTIRLIYPQIS